MTRKEYVQFSRMMRDLKPTTDAQAEEGVYCISGDSFTGAARLWSITVHAITNEFSADNPRFDRERFLLACGVTQ